MTAWVWSNSSTVGLTEVQSMQSEEPQQKETHWEQEPLLDTVESVLLDIKENPEACFGRSKRKIISRQAETDALIECLCGLVIKPSSKCSLLCKKKGCKTQWVCDFLIWYLTLLTLIFSTIYTVYLWSRHLDIGCKDEGEAPQKMMSYYYI